MADNVLVNPYGPTGAFVITGFANPENQIESGAVDSDGYILVRNMGAGGGGTSSEFGDPLPAAGTAAGFQDPDGNMAPAKVDSSGRQLVTVSGGATGGTSAVDESAFTAGTDSLTPAGGVFNDSMAALTSGEVGVSRATPNRAAHSNLRKNDGTELGIVTAPLRTDPTGTTPQPASQSGTWTVQPGNTANTTAWKVDGSAVTQPVSAASLPLPAGAATAAKQPALGTAGSPSVDVLTVQGSASGTAIPVSLASAPLPTGGATSALQTTGNTSVASIDTKTPALGQALAAASVPIVLTAAQISTLTPPAAITGFATETTLSALNTKVTAVNTGAVVVASSALPTGAATETTLGTRALEAGGNLASLVAQIGAVTASPTANTLMDRVKALLTGIVLSAGTAIIGKVGVDQTTPGTTNLVASGGVGAAGAAVAGNPVRGGGLGRTTLPTAVSSNQLVDLLLDRLGRTYTLSPILTLTSSAGTPITTNTNTSLVSAPSAGNHLRVYRVWAQNSSATGTWCYLGNGSGVKTIPFYLAQYQPMMMNLNGSWELSTATALFMNTATTGANIEWFVESETLAD